MKIVYHLKVTIGFINDMKMSYECMNYCLYLIPQKYIEKNWIFAFCYSLSVYLVLSFTWAKNCAGLKVNFDHSLLLKVLLKSLKCDKILLISRWKKLAIFWYWNLTSYDSIILFMISINENSDKKATSNSNFMLR